MTLIIVLILLLGYVAIATEHITNINKASVAMFLGVIGWLLYMFFGEYYVSENYPLEYSAYLSGTAENVWSLRSFIAQHVFVGYVASAAEIVLFFVATMNIVSVLNANECFDFISEWMRTRNSKKLVWMVALVTFLISFNLDNLTTVMMMIVILRKLIPNVHDRALYNCVVILAANCGGCCSCIGDVTTLMIWVKGAVTPTAFTVGLILPALVALAIPTYLVSRVLPERVNLTSQLGMYNGDDSVLNRWQRLLMLFVGIGGLWAIPTFHNLTKLPPFVGAMCILSILWIIYEVCNLKRMRNDVMVNNQRVPYSIQDVNSQLILFFLGIWFAIGAIEETGALETMANWLDENIHNVYIISVALGFVSSVLDNIPLVASSISMYDVVDAADVAGNNYANAFSQNGSYWQILAYCSAVGGSLMTIGSQAGFAVMKVERIRLKWYLRHFSWMVLVGWGAGLIVYWVTEILYEYCF